MINIQITKLYENVETPTVINKNFIDLKIHSFHKITEYDGIVTPENTETFLLQGGHRVLVRTGYSIELCKAIHELDYPPYQLQIISRPQCSINDGLIVLNTPCYYTGLIGDEVQILLYNTSPDRVILLKRGYRIAQAILVPKYSMNIIV